jgi:hypothetical protein
MLIGANNGVIDIQNGLKFETNVNVVLEQVIINNVPMVSFKVGDLNFGEVAGTMSITGSLAYIYDDKGDLVAVF